MQDHDCDVYERILELRLLISGLSRSLENQKRDLESREMLYKAAERKLDQLEKEVKRQEHRGRHLWAVPVGALILWPLRQARDRPVRAVAVGLAASSAAVGLWTLAPYERARPPDAMPPGPIRVMPIKPAKPPVPVRVDTGTPEARTGSPKKEEQDPKKPINETRVIQIPDAPPGRSSGTGEPSAAKTPEERPPGLDPLIGATVDVLGRRVRLVLLTPSAQPNTNP